MTDFLLILKLHSQLIEETIICFPTWKSLLDAWVFYCCFDLYMAERVSSPWRNRSGFLSKGTIFIEKPKCGYKESLPRVKELAFLKFKKVVERSAMHQTGCIINNSFLEKLKQLDLLWALSCSLFCWYSGKQQIQSRAKRSLGAQPPGSRFQYLWVPVNG